MIPRPGFTHWPENDQKARRVPRRWRWWTWAAAVGWIVLAVLADGL